MSARVTLAITLLVTAFLTPRGAQAQWIIDGIPVCAAPAHQDPPRIIFDGLGGVILTWWDNRNAPTSNDIYAQRIDIASGAARWTANGVPVIVHDNVQYNPVLVADGTGGAIIAWADRRDAHYDIYAQRVSGSGALQWDPDGVLICTGENEQFYPVITTDMAGGAIIAWEDQRAGVILEDIYAQRVNAMGVVQWTANGVAVCTAADQQIQPAIVSDQAGGAIVVWMDARTLGNPLWDIYARRIDASGVAQWTADGVALCTASNGQAYPQLVTDQAGGAIAVWSDLRAGNYDIYARRVLANGTPQWTANGNPVTTAADLQLSPVAVADELNGGVLVAWQDFRGGVDYDVYANRLTAAGAAPWSANGVLLCGASGNQYAPTIAYDGAGGAIVAWQDARGANFDIYTQRVTSAGAQWTPGGVALCLATGDQETCAAAPDGLGGAIVGWADRRSGTNDIYAQRIVGNGVPTDVGDTPSAGLVAIAANYPNPFSGETAIDFHLGIDADVAIDVFDARGRRVRHLDLGRVSAGPQSTRFDGLDDHGRGVASGVYFCRVSANSSFATRKIVVTR